MPAADCGLFLRFVTATRKRDEWVEAAKLGKDFLEKYCVDSDGRMFFQTTRDGRPLRKRRYMFSESFYVVGMAEYGAAMDDEDALQRPSLL